MKVIDLYQNEFEECCARLAEVVLEDYQPDLVIGVLNGGGVVGNNVKTFFNKKIEFKYAEIKIERPSTGLKKRINARKYLKILPKWLLNLMRIVEVHILELKSKIISPARIGQVLLDEEFDKFIRQHKSCNILIVDDCIDTGATLKLIREELMKQYGPAHNIRFAVITKAHKKPLLNVDYCLYDRVLVRFPWSFDSALIQK